MRRVKKLAGILLVTTMILGGTLSVQAGAGRATEPVLQGKVRIDDTCETPICYDYKSLQKMNNYILVYSDGSTKREKIETSVCCR